MTLVVTLKSLTTNITIIRHVTVGVMSDVIHHKNDDCICDLCIESYLQLYNKIEKLQELRLKWLVNMSKAEKDELNKRIHKSIKDKTKTKIKKYLKKEPS